MASPLTDNLTSPRLVTSPASPVRPLDAPRRTREGRWQFLVSHGLRNSSGSLAMLAAMRRASSRVSSLAAARRDAAICRESGEKQDFPWA